jgi:hypothetical protein
MAEGNSDVDKAIAGIAIGVASGVAGGLIIRGIIKGIKALNPAPRSRRKAASTTGPTPPTDGWQRPGWPPPSFETRPPAPPPRRPQPAGPPAGRAFAGVPTSRAREAPAGIPQPEARGRIPQPEARGAITGSPGPEARGALAGSGLAGRPGLRPYASGEAGAEAEGGARAAGGRAVDGGGCASDGRGHQGATSRPAVMNDEAAYRATRRRRPLAFLDCDRGTRALAEREDPTYHGIYRALRGPALRRPLGLAAGPTGPHDRLAGQVDRVAQHVVGDVGVALGRAVVLVAEHLADDLERDAVHDRVAGDGVPQVVQAHVRDPGELAGVLPAPAQTPQPLAPRGADDEAPLGLALLGGDLGEHRQDLVAGMPGALAGLTVLLGKVLPGLRVM